jgi:hypothetical protein
VARIARMMSWKLHIGDGCHCFFGKVVSGNAQHDPEVRTCGTKSCRHTECAECQRLALRVEGCTHTEEQRREDVYC